MAVVGSQFWQGDFAGLSNWTMTLFGGFSMSGPPVVGVRIKFQGATKIYDPDDPSLSTVEVGRESPEDFAVQVNQSLIGIIDSADNKDRTRLDVLIIPFTEDEDLPESRWFKRNFVRKLPWAEPRPLMPEPSFPSDDDPEDFDVGDDEGLPENFEDDEGNPEGEDENGEELPQGRPARSMPAIPRRQYQEVHPRARRTVLPSDAAAQQMLIRHALAISTQSQAAANQDRTQLLSVITSMTQDTTRTNTSLNDALKSTGVQLAEAQRELAVTRTELNHERAQLKAAQQEQTNLHKVIQQLQRALEERAEEDDDESAKKGKTSSEDILLKVLDLVKNDNGGKKKKKEDPAASGEATQQQQKPGAVPRVRKPIILDEDDAPDYSGGGLSPTQQAADNDDDDEEEEDSGSSFLSDPNKAAMAIQFMPAATRSAVLKSLAESNPKLAKQMAKEILAASKD
jgi:hypothetical protein